MSDETPKFDPFAPWKQFQGPMMDAWSKAMSEAVASDDFAKSMGDYLNSYLETSAPLQKQFEATMEKYLQGMQLPSRAEVLHLSERLTGLEMRLDDMEAKLDQILELLKK
jgi:hypothetical protein